MTAQYGTPAAPRRPTAQEASAALAQHYPALVAAGILPGGRLTSTEWGVHDRLLGDDFVIEGERLHWRIASRVGWGYDWGTYTIRLTTDAGSSATEWAKRGAAYIARTGLPNYTVQLYVARPGGALMAAYVVESEALWAHILQPGLRGLEPCIGSDGTNYAGGRFRRIAVNARGRDTAHAVTSLVQHGVPVRELHP